MRFAQTSDLGTTQARLSAFVAEVREYHLHNRRDLPWRRTSDPYEILVSEAMLQQTQVSRVLTKYPRFLEAFPTVQVLANAEVADVLALWQGLGYNRRALSLHKAAKTIVRVYGGRVPDSTAALRSLPGIGPATAGAISAFAFGRGEPFIETNIRSAFIHFFFQGRDDVADAEILPLVAATLDRDDPREWFYALMDYGVLVKKEHGNPSRRSRHHATQSKFAGSRREARAQILQALLAVAPGAVDRRVLPALLTDMRHEPAELFSVAEDLVREGFLSREGDTLSVARDHVPESTETLDPS